MPIQPGNYDITLQRRADFELEVQFKDGNSTPIDLTGWTVAAQAWNKPRSKKYADFTVAVLSLASGIVKLSMAASVTENLAGVLFYDVRLTDTYGYSDYWLQGQISVSEGYTA